MPTYEYACDKCGLEFEREQRITEDPIKTCPECRSRKVRRLISNTSFVLKGSGWYSDLYSSQKPDKKSDSSTDSADSGDKGAAAETKSQEKDKDTKKESEAKSKSKKTGKKASG